MIRITRGKAPAELRKAGSPARQKLYRAQRRGKTDLEFDRDVYALAKSALVAAQHEKCAFCEAKIRHTQPGDVEHFRPKAATRQSKDAPLRKPGYYWLAYEWTNLLLACAECNRRGKGNLFPLRDDVRRATHHRARLEDEEPLFVDPAAEDPGVRLGFRSWVAFPITERGAATIEALDLNRQPLCEHRRPPRGELSEGAADAGEDRSDHHRPLPRRRRVRRDDSRIRRSLTAIP